MKGLINKVAKPIADKLVNPALDRGGLTPNEVNQISTKLAPAQEAQEALERTQIGRVVDPARHEHRSQSLNNIQGTDDIMQLLDDTSLTFPKKKFQSNEETMKKAVAGGDDLEKMLNRKPGNWNSQQLTRGRIAMVNGAEELMDMAKKISNGDDSTESMYLFRSAVAKHTALQKQIEGAVNEAGRILQSMQIPVGSNETVQAAMTQKLAEFGTSGSTKKMAELIVKTGGDPAEIARVARGTWMKRAGQAFNEYYINNLLYGPKTHLANIAGNTAASALGVGERYVASAFGKARSLLNKEADVDRVRIEEANAMMQGMVTGYRQSFSVFARAFKEGETENAALLAPGAVKTEAFFKPSVTADNLGIDPNSAFGKSVDGIGQYYVRLPGRLLGAQDEAFKTVAYLMETNAQAIRAARAEGLEQGTPEYNKRVQDMLRGEDPVYSAAINEAGIDYAKYQTFTNELTDPVSQGVAGFANSSPLIKMHIPFVRTPTNILKYGLERSPVAPLLSKRFREDWAAGGARRDIANAKWSMGSAASMAVFGLMSNTETDSQGNEIPRPLITGAGPKSRAQMKIWREKGIQPWSIYYNGKYHSYSRLDPIGQMIGQTAAAIELANGMYSQKEREEFIFAFSAGLGEYMADKTYFQGMAELFSLFDGQKKLSTHVAGKLTSLTPKILADLAKATDNDEDGNPILRETRAATFMGTLIKKAKNRIPGLKNDLLPRVDVLGNDVILDKLGWYGFNLSPKQASMIQNDDVVANELFEQGYGFMEPQSTMTITPPGRDQSAQIDLLAVDSTGKLFYEWQKMVGKAGYNEIKDVMRTREYGQAGERSDVPKAGRRWYLQGAARRGKQDAYTKFVQRFGSKLYPASIELIEKGQGNSARPFTGSDSEDRLEGNPFK